jgi:hypothetical protein
MSDERVLVALAALNPAVLLGEALYAVLGALLGW